MNSRYIKRSAARTENLSHVEHWGKRCIMVRGCLECAQTGHRFDPTEPPKPDEATHWRRR